MIANLIQLNFHRRDPIIKRPVAHDLGLLRAEEPFVIMEFMLRCSFRKGVARSLSLCFLRLRSIGSAECGVLLIGCTELPLLGRHWRQLLNNWAPRLAVDRHAEGKRQKACCKSVSKSFRRHLVIFAHPEAITMRRNLADRIALRQDVPGGRNCAKLPGK